jgi:hypothetical protein
MRDRHFAAKVKPERHKTVSTERAQHTTIPLPRDKEPLRFGSKRAKFVLGSIRSATRGNMVSTLRSKATNFVARNRYPALEAESTPGT